MKVEFLGAAIDSSGLDDTLAKVCKIAEGEKPGRVLTLNPELLFRAQKSPGLLDLIRRADLVTADGVGIVWGCHMAGVSLPGRVTGIDLSEKLMAVAARKGWPVFLLGSRPGVAEEAGVKLAGRYKGLRVAGTYHGYFSPAEEKDVVQMISQARPKILLVGMGAPSQDFFIDWHLDEMGVSVAIGVGGSLDVWSGRVKRVPECVRRLHLEWLGRLLYEPARWKRMLVLPRYVLLVIWHYRFLKGRN